MHKERLKQCYPFLPHKLHADDTLRRRVPKSWLSAGFADGRLVGFGCKACSHYAKHDQVTGANQDNFSLFKVRTTNTALPWNFTRHAASRAHMENVRRFAALDKGVELDHLSPPAESFGKAWDALRAGRAPRAGVEGVGAQHKVEKLAWCLAESMWALDRQFLGRAGVVVTLLRDERKQRLLCRFKACGDDLRPRTGVLGQAKHFGTASEKITDATRSILKSFATTKFSPPGVKGDVASYSRDLKNRICQAICHLAIDAAKDEMLGARQLKEGNRDCLRPLCPNLKTVVRDRPHGSRRTRIRYVGGTLSPPLSPKRH
jgi:hypothetical protein